jgi:alginate O-acetyltransferase complex protein AlgI
MEFTSIYYLLFLTITTIIYHTIQPKFKSICLIIFSCFFIGLHSFESLIIFFIGTLTTQLLALNIESKIQNKLLFFRLGIIFNIFFVFIFKYLESNQKLFSTFDSNKTIAFLGVSFFSLQNISYIIDVYYNRIPTISFKKIILINSFFPKITAGPITTFQNFKIEETNSNSTFIKSGINRIALGIFKKVVLADRIAPIITYNFIEIDSKIGLTNLVVSFLFTIQLYFDFSAYTDIAIGSAKLFGIELPENFNIPLRAKSISEFWRKWHITLTNWLTQYIFYPISYRYRKLKKRGVIFALIITFLISGIWHGIGFTFILYAISHTLYLTVETLYKKQNYLIENKAINYIFNFIVFSLVSLSFIFFRSTSINQAFSKINTIFSSNFLPKNLLFDFTQYITIKGDQENIFNFYITLILVIGYLIYEKRIQTIFKRQSLTIFGISIIVLLISFFGIFDSTKNFIYNQF